MKLRILYYRCWRHLPPWDIRVSWRGGWLLIGPFEIRWKEINFTRSNR